MLEAHAESDGVRMKKQYSGPSLEHAQHHYRGPLADTYDAKRQKKSKWRLEYECLESMLRSTQGTVLDVPVGTGRFLQLYKDLGLKAAGVDYNNSMLDHARNKYPDAILEQGDITKLRFADGSFDTVVCVRMLHLITPHEVTIVIRELQRVARSHVIVSANVGEVTRSNRRSRTHTMGTLLSCMNPLAWTVDAPVQVLGEDGKLGPYYMLHFRR